MDPGDVYFNKQTPTNANDNTTLSAVAAGIKNTPKTYNAPVSGYIDKVEHPLYCEDVCSQYYVMLTYAENDQILINVGKALLVLIVKQEGM